MGHFNEAFGNFNDDVLGDIGRGQLCKSWWLMSRHTFLNLIAS